MGSRRAECIEALLTADPVEGHGHPENDAAASLDVPFFGKLRMRALATGA